VRNPALKARFSRIPEKNRDRARRNGFGHLEESEWAFSARVSGNPPPRALPYAAVGSCAVAAQNLNRENCFASLPWIALCWSSKSS
jgi:hypothetical protein